MTPQGWTRLLLARVVPGREAASGFTLVELATVAVVMGTLVRIAAPNLHDVVVDARAAEVVADFETVRLAVANFHADELRFPDDAYPGQVPPGLADYLPEGFDFQGAGYQLGWENWSLPGGLPGNPSVTSLIGITLVTPDREMGVALLDLLGATMASYVLDDSYTFILDGM